ncbi:hypothetical protein EB796_003843 [Bugula neritina]|uniref:Uncharacterized protein n=1 Tax=Bugula neritina TaxID=10212 RepID=A0A7J7KKI6_BUGNE|nr:hypothetical protein EB796_003843 [Bugula neritina]
MAGKPSANSLTKLLEDLDCAVCFESCQLLLLPCQHRFCESCIEQLTKKSSSSTVKCPECRRVYRVPPDGFQVCRLSLAVREHIECALKKESVTQTNDVLPPQTLSLTNPEKKLNGDYSSNKTADLSCEQCDKEIDCRCICCKRFLCYRCIIRSVCEDSDDTGKHAPSADLTYIKQEADNVLSTWKYCIYKELECITDAKEKKTKRSIVVATEDVINVETDVIERIQMIEQISKTDIFGETLDPGRQVMPRKSREAHGANGDVENTSLAGLQDKIVERVTKKRKSKKFNSIASPDVEALADVKAFTGGMEDSGIHVTETLTVETEKRGRALYPFVQTEIAENLVPIEENEVFTIICIGNDGWTEIRKDCGTTGLVPTDYIQQTS